MKDNPDLSRSTFAVEQHSLDEDMQFVCAIPMGVPTVKGVLLFVL